MLLYATDDEGNIVSQVHLRGGQSVLQVPEGVDFCVVLEDKTCTSYLKINDEGEFLLVEQG